MTDEAIATDPTHERVKRLLEFLKRFDERRAPPRRTLESAAWNRALADLPGHPAVQLGAADGDGTILRIERPPETQCPPPPRLLEEWLLSGWRDAARTAEHLPTITRVLGNGAGRDASIECFEQEPRRVAAWAQWQAVRDAWVEAERPAREAEALFQDVLALWSRLQREGEALRVYLGDAFLICRSPGDPDGPLQHPLILLEVELVFDEKTRQLKFIDAGKPPVFYAQVLSTLEDLDGQVRRLCRKIVDQSADNGGCHPLAGAPTDAVVKQLAAVLKVQEVVEPETELREPTERRIVQRRAVLFAVPPLLGFSAACDAFLQALPTLTSYPLALLQIVGEQPPGELEQSAGERIEVRPSVGTELFFTLEANHAQEEIARRLDTAKTVLVQGPPGTGKTHTIANLIGHYLAKGERVLVTAATTKALRVLRDKVTPPLQPLCVSVLDSDLASRSELEHAVNGIVSHLTQDPRSYDLRATGMQKERARLLSSIDALQRDLSTATHREYENLIVAGQSFSPSDAAKHVAAHAATDAWLPGPIAPGAPLPVDASDMAELYRLTAELDAADEQVVRRGVPDPTPLLTLDQFAGLIAKLARPPLPTPQVQVPPGLTRHTLQELRDAVTRTLDVIANAPPWRIACAEAGLVGGPRRTPFDALASLIDRVAQEAPPLAALADENEVSLKIDDIDHAAKTCGEILAHLERGGSLSWLALFRHGTWSTLLESVTVRGRKPASNADLKAVEAALRLEAERDQLRRRWKAVLGQVGHPLPDDQLTMPEQYAHATLREMQRALTWGQEVLSPCLDSLAAHGLDCRTWMDSISSFPPNAEVMRATKCLGEVLLPALDFAIDRIDREILEQRLAAGLSSLPSFPWVGGARDALLALEARDVGAYASALEQLWRLWNLCVPVARRVELLAKLDPTANAWAGAIRARNKGHEGPEPPGDVLAAWLFRQLHDELTRRDALDSDDIQRKLSAARTSLRVVTAQLVENCAWAAQMKRTKPDEHRALMSWLDTVRRIGKGMGKRERVQHLQREAQKHIEVARGCVPVWIMPLSRVYESFRPGEAHFDVVILDEASQCDVRAIVAMMLGAKVVVVGDDEQVSPMDVGKNVDQVTALQDEYLFDFADRATFDGKTSAYELARRAFPGGLVRLTEHFRCVPDIIGFSNQLSYKGEITPLRESSDARVFPPTVAHRVAAGIREEDAKTNRVEALEVASLVAAACEVPEYRGLSMGVVGLLGDHQAKEIEFLLQRFLDPAQYKLRRLICGSAAHFQGDERDVMFLSMVYSSSPHGPHPLQNTDDLKRRYNVAASRARDQMWLVHSLDPEKDLKPEDVRRRLLVHVLDPKASDKRREQQRAESPFERLVLDALIERGFRVRSQFEVGGYRIDIVVEGTHGRVAVECDGDRYHPVEQIDADMQRQAILERLGWRFIRVRGSAFYRDPTREIQRLVQRLKDAGISPVGHVPHSAAAATTNAVHAVVARAAELRSRWLEGVDNIDALFARVAERQSRLKITGLLGRSSEIGAS